MSKQRAAQLLCLLVAVIAIIAISCGIEAATYTDTEHWAKNYINYNTEHGYFNGMSASTFAPEGKITRGQMATVLSRHAKVDLSDYKGIAFSDVASNQYFSASVSWARDNMIMLGDDNGRFYPNDPITRQEAAAMICRYLFRDDGQSYLSTSFSDESLISVYAKGYVETLTQNKIMNGYPDGTFRPQNQITRAEMCVIMANVDGEKLENYKVPVVKQPAEQKPTMSYVGQFKLTCYCSSCNSPRGSRQTASGKLATAGSYGTIAVHPNLYKQYKAGTVLYIEGVGYRKIQDKHGNSSNVIDIYTGEGACRCAYNAWSGKYAKVYVVR